MSSGLPTESAADMAVDDFGLGPWDSTPSSTTDHGEDMEGVRSERNPRGKSVPDNGGPEDMGPELLIGYPTTANSKLPSDEDNPSARSDYYDRMTMGQTEDLWPSEDSGVYAQEGDETLPGGSPENESSIDNNLGALGNAWSGYITQDQSKPNGFPSEDFRENVDYRRNDLNGGGTSIASKDRTMHKLATNHALVRDLTAEFLKEFGKKDLTRRHVMAFLQKGSHPQFLASDIIRCLKLSHDVFVKDVLDEFPVAKTASQRGLSAVREQLIHLEAANVTNPDVAYHFRRCAARISQVLADLERLEDRNG